MLTTTAVDTGTAYRLTVTDGTEANTFMYDWGKQPPAGQTTAAYLQTCKTEAERLAQSEIDSKAAPTPITI